MGGTDHNDLIAFTVNLSGCRATKEAGREIFSTFTSNGF